MKTFLCIFLVALSFATAFRVKRQNENCSKGDHVGKRCVDQHLCAPKIENPCSDFADLDYKCVNEDACNPIAFTRRTTLDERHDLAFNATCTTNGQVCCQENSIDEDALYPDIDERQSIFKDPLCVHDGQICCPEDKIEKIQLVSFACLSKTEEGYGCHEIDDCEESSINENGHCHGKRTNLFTPPKNNICCFKKQSQTEKCSDFEDQDFQCVAKNKCNRPSPIIPLQLNSELHDRAFGAECNNGNDVCCHTNAIKPPSCSTYPDFACQSKSNCLDEWYPDVKDSIERHGKCGRRRGCCKNKKPTEEQKPGNSCNENNYGCHILQKCNLDLPVYKSGSDDLLSIIGESLKIDEKINKCDKENEICCSPLEGTPTSRPPRELGCGRRNPNGLSTEAKNPQDGDRSTNLGEWPFVCLLYKKGSFGIDSLIGGASLLAPGVVLTAAHKIEDSDPKDILVRCGEWDVDSPAEDELYAAQDRDVQTIMIHPLYNPDFFENDLALLILENFFELGDHLDTICLPADPATREGNYLDSGCVIMGWGNRAIPTANGARKSFQSIMEAVHNVPIINHDQCESTIRNLQLRFRGYDLPDSLLCAGGVNEMDACEGDGGGPLVCPVDDSENPRYVLAGAVVGAIAGSRCGEKGKPGTFVDVQHNLCFIHWATKCAFGQEFEDSVSFSYPQCDDWMEKTKDKLRESGDPDDYLFFAEELEASCKA